MFENADITIYHLKKEQGESAYIPIPIKRVSMRGEDELNFTGKNVLEKDEYLIRIYSVADTNGKEYREGKIYSVLADEARYWTVMPGDYIVRGLFDDEISAPSELLQRYDDVYKVISARDNRESAEYIGHIKVVVKK